MKECAIYGYVSDDFVCGNCRKCDGPDEIEEVKNEQTSVTA